jgi:hypothetical protein
MEEAPENGKESSILHMSMEGMNEYSSALMTWK